MIRVTTNSTLHMYQSNLMQSSNQLYSAMEKLMTGRNFDSYASNPAGATRAFKLHSALNAVNAQAANNETVLNKFGTAYSILDEVTNELTHDLRRLPHWRPGQQPSQLAQLLRPGHPLGRGRHCSSAQWQV